MNKSSQVGEESVNEERASGLSEQTRRELADFLRTRREKLKPEQVGLALTSRRRTPGLRREEVAELAGVGTTWYTWLEQARDIQPSVDVLKRLAQALLLNQAEVRHLFALAGKAVPNEKSLVTEIPSAALLRVLEYGFKVPTMILGARWDVLAINQLMRDSMPGLTGLADRHGNWLHHIFTAPRPRERMISWESTARRILAEFRSSQSDMIDNPWVIELIDTLRAESPEFAQWWREHDVQDNAPVIFEVLDQTGVPVRRERTMLAALDNSRFKFVMFNTLS